jgi:ABC-type bacteriocin/lantibiotic exporter with double-glycine peptidase domain
VLAAGALSGVIAGALGAGLALKDMADHPERYANRIARLQGLECAGGNGLTLQKKGNNCGPVAVLRFLQTQGIEEKLETLEAQMMDVPGGTSMRRMKSVIEGYGFATRARRITEQELDQIPLPSMALDRRNHFVLVEELREEKELLYFDPSLGRCRINAVEFIRRTEGMMLLIWKPVP